MKVYIGDVKKEVGWTSKESLRKTFPPLSFGNEKTPFAQPVQVDLIVTNCGSGLLLEGQIKTALILPCSRCLEPFIYKVEAPLKLEFRNLDRITRASDFEAEAKSADDMYYYHEEDAVIDIEGGVIEALLVHFPMKPICSEGCQGLCPICGINLNQNHCDCKKNNIDPRLAALKKIKLEKKV
ncbi:MAG TPA: YceD family protein [Atribacter sp.]|jgi:uncharacterized protein|uniref:YceD family protein n=1 Tax=Atribacter sp. TaxID=2847780 RepID=UPI002BF75BEB|nr:YceD family protein [Atribacter sp.]MDD3713521.1 YceD family protein [Atribacterota bacterium]MDI9593912.1 YceD family protein [Atribacterota bacterium]HOT05924.1 YceD family protein [Atribacter sp.]HQK84206.1 YceD family protein [Atribacter sp.]